MLPPLICAGGMGISPMMVCMDTDFPQPDSPTMDSVSPGSEVEGHAAHGSDLAVVYVEGNLQDP